MAIFSWSISVVKRSDGKSSVAAAAYRSGTEMEDERTGLKHDYSKKKGVAESFIATPDGAPEWMQDRKKLWNHIEKTEKRVNSQTARDFIIALPKELSLEKNKDLISDYVRENFTSKGLVSDVNIHMDNPDNPHAHIMSTLSGVEGDGFGRKTDYRHLNKKEQFEEWKKGWATSCNKHLEMAGSNERIDHRSNKERGIEKIPQIHLGPKVHAMAKKGIVTDRFREYVKIDQKNEQMSQINTEVKRLEQQKEKVASGQYQRNTYTPPTKTQKAVRKVKRTANKVKWQTKKTVWQGKKAVRLVKKPFKAMAKQGNELDRKIAAEQRGKDLYNAYLSATDQAKTIGKTLKKEGKIREDVRSLSSKLDGLKRKLIKTKGDKQEIERLENQKSQKEQELKDFLEKKPSLEKEQIELEHQSKKSLDEYRKLQSEKIDVAKKQKQKTKSKKYEKTISKDDGVTL